MPPTKIPDRFVIMIGKKVAHYQILDRLGSGGMGDVYRARDIKLGRDIAIKVLLPGITADPNRLQRFEQEARAAAALNHPNIVTVYSVEVVEGMQFLTMELIDGKSLAELIPKNGMRIEEILKLAIPLADAISVAHGRGITHRDLKPSNIMVTTDGRVKVLDFGLAKLKEAAAAGDDMTTAASIALTGEGQIVGTVNYMSPEQAEGKTIDHRSDIFSLGVVVYEMATGERPFKGDTKVSVISSIIKDTPKSVTELNLTQPREIAHIIKRCLAKDTARRYQSAADLRNELEELRDEIASGVTAVGGRPVLEKSPVRHRWLMPAGIGVVILAAAAFGAYIRNRSALRPAGSFDQLEINRLTHTGKELIAAISGDGRYVAHVVGDAAEQSLWIRQTGTTSDVQIVPPAAVRYDGVAFSPDQNYVYYNSYARNASRANLYQLPVLGGTPRQILEDVDTPVCFSADGRQFIFQRGFPSRGEFAVMAANIDGTSERTVKLRKAPEFYPTSVLACSPDGKHLATPASSLAAGGAFQLVVVDVGTGSETVLGTQLWVDMSGISWTSDGRGLIVTGADRFSTSQLWHLSYPDGVARKITNDLNGYRGISMSADSRSIIANQGQTLSQMFVVENGDEAHAKRITSGAGRHDGLSGIAWTPDGKIVYTSEASGNPDIWMMDSDGTNQKQLTVGPTPEGLGSVSPDGRYIFFVSVRMEGPRIWRMDRDGTNLKQLSIDAVTTNPEVSADGQWVLYTFFSNGQPSIWKTSIDGGTAGKVSDLRLFLIGLSPDGKMIAAAYYDPDKHLNRIAVLPVEGGSPQFFDGIVGSLRWAADSQALSYVETRGGVSNLWMRPLKGGPPSQITHFTQDRIFSFAWSRDGKKLAYTQGQPTYDLVLISNGAPKAN